MSKTMSLAEAKKLYQAAKIHLPNIPPEVPPGVDDFLKVDLAANEIAIFASTSTTAPEKPKVAPPPTSCSPQQAWPLLGSQGRAGYSYEEIWDKGCFPLRPPRRRTGHWLALYNAVAGDPSEKHSAHVIERRLSEYSTQKVKGILTLAFESSAYYMALGAVTRPSVHDILKGEDDLVRTARHNIRPHMFPMFARPCPVKPQHGFVESRLVSDFGGIIDVLLEAKSADKGAEVLLMPPLSGRYSGVITVAGVALGRGNDGATGGKLGSVFIPCPTDHDQRMTRLCAGPCIEGSPYVEFVEHKLRPCLVQLRDGPPPPGGTSANWVPKPVLVTKVLRPTSHTYASERFDLPQWKAYLDTLKKADKVGVIASLPGHTLASHMAVQAICHDIPVVTDGPVVTGDTVPASEGGKGMPLRASDYREIASNLASRLLHPLVPRGWAPWANGATLLVMGVAHSQALWPGGRSHLNALRGQAVALAIRLGMTVCMGESRHHSAQCGGADDTIPRLSEYLRSIGRYKQDLHADNEVIDRNAVFAWGLDCPVLEGAKWTRHALDMFAEGGWGKQYGGESWERITSYTLDLLIAAHQFVCAPRKGTWVKVAGALDLLADAIHNNGYAFNKFVGAAIIGLVAEEPVWGFLSPIAAEIALLRVHTPTWTEPSFIPRAVTTFRSMEVPNVEEVKS